MLTGVLQLVITVLQRSGLPVDVFPVNCMMCNVVVVQLTANATCFTLNQTKSIIVENVQPASVTTYLYYDPRESQATRVCSPITIKNIFFNATLKPLKGRDVN